MKTRWLSKHRWWLWWAVVTVGLGLGLYARQGTIFAEDVSRVNEVLVYWWLALLCLPLVREFTIGGISFKTALEGFQEEQKRELEALRIHIDTRLAVVTQIQNQVLVVPSAADLERLPAILRKEAIVPKPEVSSTASSPDATAAYLADFTRKLSSELNRLARVDVQNEKSVVAPEVLAEGLARNRVLTQGVQQAINTLLAVSQSYLRGAHVTDDKIQYVRQLGPELLDVLQATDPVDSKPELPLPRPA